MDVRYQISRVFGYGLPTLVLSIPLIRAIIVPQTQYEGLVYISTIVYFFMFAAAYGVYLFYLRKNSEDEKITDKLMPNIIFAV